MKLLSIMVEGFRSFRKKQTLALNSLQPGLYHITGKNEVEKELEANGAGKSSLFEAVYWTLYGKTSRNVKADAVKSWGHKGLCRVDLKTNVGTIARQRKAGQALSVDGKEVDQSHLESMIHLSSDSFLHVVYFAQFSPSFIDLAPAARMDLYSEIMNLQLWETTSQQASSLSKAYEGDVIDQEALLAGIRGRLKELRALDYSGSERAWERERKARIEVLQAEREDAWIEVKRAQKSLAVAEENALAFGRKKISLERQMKATSLQIQKAREGRVKLSHESSSLEKQIKDQESVIEEMEKGKGKCDVCGQEITPRYRKAHLAHMRQAAKAKLNARRQIDGDLKNTINTCRSLESELEKLEREMPNAEMFSVLLGGARARLEAVKKEAGTSTKQIKAIKEEANPWKAKKEEVEARIKTIESKAKLLTEEIEELRWYQNAFSFWSKRMKDVRYFLIQESLKQLTLEVNESLWQLGLREWSIEFQVEKESKSGNVKRGFLCQVSSPHSKELIPWEAWSGGESQRLRLSVQLGVSNMLAAKIGMVPNFEFWDEPSTWLSEGGIKDLLHVLEERAVRYNRKILLADHRVLDFPFAGTINVTKMEDGSVVTIS